jgi:hypothetical protein
VLAGVTAPGGLFYLAARRRRLFAAGPAAEPVAETETAEPEVDDSASVEPEAEPDAKREAEPEAEPEVEPEAEPEVAEGESLPAGPIATETPDSGADASGERDPRPPGD